MNNKHPKETWIQQGTTLQCRQCRARIVTLDSYDAIRPGKKHWKDKHSYWEMLGSFYSTDVTKRQALQYCDPFASPTSERFRRIFGYMDFEDSYVLKITLRWLEQIPTATKFPYPDQEIPENWADIKGNCWDRKCRAYHVFTPDFRESLLLDWLEIVEKREKTRR